MIDILKIYFLDVPRTYDYLKYILDHKLQKL